MLRSCYWKQEVKIMTKRYLKLKGRKLKVVLNSFIPVTLFLNYTHTWGLFEHQPTGKKEQFSIFSGLQPIFPVPSTLKSYGLTSSIEKINIEWITTSMEWKLHFFSHQVNHACTRVPQTLEIPRESVGGGCAYMPVFFK